MTLDISIEPCNANPPMDLLLLADESEEMVGEYLKPGECFIAKFEGEIIGVTVVLKTRPKTMEIMNIAVRPDFQNRGVGTRLINFAVQKAKDDNMSVLEIGTGNAGIGQLSLYQKCGFRIVGIDFDFFRKHYNHIMIENGIECRDMIRLRMDL